jgi:hypothetical protein
LVPKPQDNSILRQSASEVSQHLRVQATKVRAPARFGETGLVALLALPPSEQRLETSTQRLDNWPNHVFLPFTNSTTSSGRLVSQAPTCLSCTVANSISLTLHARALQKLAKTVARRAPSRILAPTNVERALLCGRRALHIRGIAG